MSEDPRLVTEEDVDAISTWRQHVMTGPATQSLRAAVRELALLVFDRNLALGVRGEQLHDLQKELTPEHVQTLETIERYARRHEEREYTAIADRVSALLARLRDAGLPAKQAEPAERETKR